MKWKKFIFLSFRVRLLGMLRFKKKNMATFKPINTIFSSIKYVKDNIEPSCMKCVYLNAYSCGKPYVGETRHSIKTSIQEHFADIKHNQFCSSTLEKHSKKTKHPICIEKFQCPNHN